ncbi:MAG: hypothetical protein EOP49_24330 [Sphingobacteriales bacterium]|nr:MAG: hypothetical protein EOP49_24330 [Sphingobacteriales bacterium]
MKENESFWQRLGLHEWFLKDDGTDKVEANTGLTPDQVYHYVLEKFHESINKLSFADRVVFYHEYIICFNTDDFQDFIENKKGLFGLIAQETVKEFHKQLKDHKKAGKLVVPSANKWVFRFVSHPDYAPGDKGFIGKLLPDTSLQKEDNLRVTYIPRQTGIAQTVDINQDVLQAFNYYSEGYYELPLEDLVDGKEGWDMPYGGGQSAKGKAKGRLETILPDKAYSGKKLQYKITDNEVVVSGNDAGEEEGVFRIPSDWVNTPHLKIRFEPREEKFYLASFGEKTILNETEVPRSEFSSPDWVELPFNSHIVLNGIVGVNIFKA